MATIDPRPSLLWRLPVLAGVGTLAVLSTSDAAWEAWEAKVGDALPREAVRGLLGVTVALHVVEAAAAAGMARGAGLDRPGRWARTTLVYGFPVLGRLRRARDLQPVDEAGAVVIAAADAA